MPSFADGIKNLSLARWSQFVTTSYFSSSCELLSYEINSYELLSK